MRRSISFTRFNTTWIASSVWSLFAENLVNALATPSNTESTWLEVGCSFALAFSPIFSSKTTASSAEIIPLSTNSKILSF